MSRLAARERPLVRVGSLVAPAEEVVGLTEVAELLGVTKRTVQRYYSERDDFPEPLGHLAGGRVWLRSDVEAWAKQTLPLKVGRPRKETP
jgi:predicted DNA-binding transcriptional regulator AlpA